MRLTHCIVLNLKLPFKLTATVARLPLLLRVTYSCRDFCCDLDTISKRLPERFPKRFMLRFQERFINIYEVRIIEFGEVTEFANFALIVYRMTFLSGKTTIEEFGLSGALRRSNAIEVQGLNVLTRSLT